MIKEWKNLLENKNCCFELFGFDILLDSNLSPWLLEINLTPSLHCDSHLDLKIKSKLVADILNLSLIVPPSRQGKEIEYLKNYVIKDHVLAAANELAQAESYKGFKLNSYLKYQLWRESEEENKTGDWKRIFPIVDSVKYLKYFEGEKEINILFALKECNTDPKESKKLKLNYFHPFINKKQPK